MYRIALSVAQSLSMQRNVLSLSRLLVLAEKIWTETNLKGVAYDWMFETKFGDILRGDKHIDFLPNNVVWTFSFRPPLAPPQKNVHDLNIDISEICACYRPGFCSA